jgi:MoaA/NifB/PqqE/SkfB family radical SAM enzyme
MNAINSVYIELTGNCDQRCPYCYNHALVNSGGELDADRVIALLTEAI